MEAEVAVTVTAGDGAVDHGGVDLDVLLAVLGDETDRLLAGAGIDGEGVEDGGRGGWGAVVKEVGDLVVEDAEEVVGESGGEGGRGEGATEGRRGN